MKTIIDISDFVPVKSVKKTKEELKTRFIKRRKEKGYTQRELSEQSLVSYGSIRRFESNGDISLESLLRLSFSLGLLEEFDNLFIKSIVKDIRPHE
jgi:transcriptional regulator with XRE-family HTH domain